MLFIYFKEYIKYTFNCFNSNYNNVFMVVSISLILSVPKKGISPFFGTDRIIKFHQMKSYHGDSSRQYFLYIKK
jgi:hypothetical protein